MILAATGHRPNKLVGLSQGVLHDLATSTILEENASFGISGMARGWDTIWALALLEVGVPLIAAVPFEGQEKGWSSEDRQIYDQIIEQATKVVVVVQGGYKSWAYQVRNKWMVDNCQKLIALWDGSQGGTANCIRYAKKVDRPWVNLWGAV